MRINRYKYGNLAYNRRNDIKKQRVAERLESRKRRQLENKTIKDICDELNEAAEALWDTLGNIFNEISDEINKAFAKTEIAQYYTKQKYKNPYYKSSIPAGLLLYCMIKRVYGWK